MNNTNRLAALAGYIFVVSVAFGCGSEPSQEPGFLPYPDSPLSAKLPDYAMAVGALSVVEVGPWRSAPSILENHGQDFRLVSAESSHPEIFPDDFELPAGASHEHHLGVRAAEEGRAWLRVEGRLDPTTRAFQSVALSAEEPVDAKIHFRCPDGTDTPVFVSDGEPVQFGVIAFDASGEPLAGYLDRDIELVGPNGERPPIEALWRSNLQFARSSFVPPAPGEYVVQLERFGRSATFEVVGSEAAEELGTGVCDGSRR